MASLRGTLSLRGEPDGMLERAAIIVESLALSLWTGAMAGFAFIFAPIAFRTIGNMTTFGATTSGVLGALTTFGAWCGGISIAAGFGRGAKSEVVRLRLVRAALVVVAIGPSNYEQRAILPAMNATAAEIPGAIDSVPKEDPRRVAYDAEHSSSTRVYGLAFLCVAAATALVAFGRTRKNS